MVRIIIYRVTTGLLILGAALAGITYLLGGQQTVQGFTHVGYPQQLRVVLGIAKLLGAVGLLAQGFPRVQEWTYAGFTFTWICAFVAHYLAKDAEAFLPLILLLLLVISYVTRATNRRWRVQAERA